MTRRKLTKGMQAALARTQAVHQDIQDLQRARVPVQYLEVGQLRPSPFQARLDFTDLEGLTDDIRTNGILQPLVARSTADGYELIAGERRWRAARRAGLSEVPVMLREATDEQARLYSLKENLERQDLNAFEVASVALALTALSLDQTQETVRARLTVRGPVDPEVEQALAEALSVLGKDLTRLSFTKHYLPLLNLPPALKDAIRRGASFNAVRVLRRATPQQQAEWLPRIETGEWGVRDVEAALQGAASSAAPAGESNLSSETRRVLRLASPRRIQQLDDRAQKELQRLLQRVETLLSQATP
ncbi:ParB/RepB/Spo0J family partition protein (plasmid) [Deinococcus taeanensis]|uniref:ParB/RepB/Spo0J family partition protein n=1 Tax=Deinococcus taeanensis TaxID=2737050 RepID=UPI001CDC5E86|nr:ParB/RepB/Spo0J family partition protein [Deinococcus taeanensis]UBV44594.1 ParB/RepB/Spo0J family partition protein [Deinococcus taeanensis]